jgi:hypothetical protein
LLTAHIVQKSYLIKRILSLKIDKPTLLFLRKHNKEPTADDLANSKAQTNAHPGNSNPPNQETQDLENRVDQELAWYNEILPDIDCLALVELIKYSEEKNLQIQKTDLEGDGKSIIRKFKDFKVEERLAKRDWDIQEWVGIADEVSVEKARKRIAMVIIFFFLMERGFFCWKKWGG